LVKEKNHKNFLVKKINEQIFHLTFNTLESDILEILQPNKFGISENNENFRLNWIKILGSKEFILP